MDREAQGIRAGRRWRFTHLAGQALHETLCRVRRSVERIHGLGGRDRDPQLYALSTLMKHGSHRGVLVQAGSWRCYYFRTRLIAHQIDPKSHRLADFCIRRRTGIIGIALNRIGFI